MATSGLTCVVRQSFRKFVQPCKANLLSRKAQKAPVITSVFCPCRPYCSTTANTGYRDDANVQYRHGLSVFTVPLPSRNETCEFILKPVSHTVKDFVAFLQDEDKGIDRAAIYTEDGTKVAGSTTIDILLRSDFRIVINEDTFHITMPDRAIPVSSEDFDRLSEVRGITAKLYSQLNVEEHQLHREAEIIQQLEGYQDEIAPLVKVKEQMEEKIFAQNNLTTYAGGMFMGAQFGFFARLTWFEYSWDVMEPVTYFATYAAVIVMYAYFIVVSKEYNYESAWDREFLNKFHKMAQKQKFDVVEFNRLVSLIAECESDLRRLRDPLQVHLPIREI